MKFDYITKKDLVYWILMLGLLFLLSLTHNLGNNNNILNYLSFASTSISIVLSLLAIIYTFFQNFYQNSTVENLNKSSSDIRDSTNSLSLLMTKINEATSMLHQGIDNKMNLFNVNIETSVHKISEMFEKKSLDESNNSSKIINDSENIEIKHFIENLKSNKNSSIEISKVFQFIRNYYEKGKEFTIEMMFDELNIYKNIDNNEFPTLSYKAGYLELLLFILLSLNLISLNVTNEQYSIKSISPLISNK
ncbi:hypothetical protein [Leptospira noguchii]|uniref:hypothetical protein n=1 Tax=Leptospira noguchii TaxID=28182 RepID=UPI000773E96C|nr:hypothetical protein [Leptospira noguchii]UOG50912.1 hypothetical protein MAL00_19315 [Leptospira noguchii]